MLDPLCFRCKIEPQISNDKELTGSIKRSPVETSSVVKKTCSYSILDFCHGVSELFGDCLTLERFDGIGLRGSWHDDEGYDCGIRMRLLQAEIETSQGFDKHIDALVTVLVSTRSEHL